MREKRSGIYARQKFEATLKEVESSHETEYSIGGQSFSREVLIKTLKQLISKLPKDEPIRKHIPRKLESVYDRDSALLLQAEVVRAYKDQSTPQPKVVKKKNKDNPFGVNFNNIGTIKELDL